MMARQFITALGVVVCAVGAASILHSSRALSRDEVHSGEAGPAAAAAHSAYQAHLAANDAAAERWRAAHDIGRADTPLDAEAPIDTHGCPEGTQYWRRDTITELCAPLCGSDLDCGPEDGRCRLLDVEEQDDAALIVLVDETPVEELEALELDETKQATPIRVCDPFWDVEGATDAELVAVAEAP